MSIPKVLFIQTFAPGVTYYRMYLFAQKMSEMGLVHSRMFPAWNPKKVINPDWEDKIDDYKMTMMEMVKWADVVVSQYVSTPEAYSMIKTISEFKPCYMEVDDFFSQLPYQHPAFETCSPGHSQDYYATQQLMVSYGLICSTHYLADLYRKHNSRVHVVPNCIDFNEWDKYSPKKHDKIRIGWIGGASHNDDLKLCKDALYEVIRRHPESEVYIVSYPPPAWNCEDRMVMVNQWSTIDKYPQHVKELSFDIGIAPLRDNYFNRAKSNLRYLEMSACNIPTVASCVEPFKHDFVGKIATDTEEWVDDLSRLVEKKSFRESLGEYAYRDSKEKFNLEKISEKYAQILTV
jgi:glycosyltransferase involved in cell wall biosynthesis